jgi:Leucine-rich repeat (LRR) protein
MCNISKLQSLTYSFNKFSGTINDHFGDNLPNLFILWLAGNRLSGMKTLIYVMRIFVLTFADLLILSGTIPPSMGKMLKLKFLFLRINQFSGSIPESMNKLSKLQFFYISYNHFTGSFPLAANLHNLGFMSNFFINSNLYDYPTIPNTLANMTKLVQLNLSDSNLQGTIPSGLGRLSKLHEFDVSSNYLTSTLPSEFIRLTNLKTFITRFNNLKGSIAGLFSNASSINVIDFSDNAFSSQIPNELFDLPKLTIMALVKNCFTGTLDSSICAASQLNILALDGLSQSPLCKRGIFEGLYSSAMHGHIPPCIWSMTSLEVVHLAGNGFSGKLYDIPDNKTFLDITVSHNR